MTGSKLNEKHDALTDAIEYATAAIARTPVTEGPIMVPREKLQLLIDAAAPMLGLMK